MSGIRRIVASCGPDGRSRVERDEAVAFFGSPAWPNRGAADLWATAGAISNAGSGAPSRDRPIPGPGGTAFFIMRCPPESELDAMPAEQRAAAMQSPADHVPGLIAADRSRHHAMHASDTLDYCVLLSGELSAVLDDGEVTLKAGDTLIQRGTAHAWVNRGTEPALLAVIVLGAEPLAHRPLPEAER